MKKSIQILGMFILIILIASCKKMVDKDFSISPYETKINKWIDAKIPVNESGKIYEEQLKSGLDYTRMREEASFDSEKILIIPIKENFLEFRKAEEGCSGNLVVLIDKKDEIRRMNIVLFKPETSSQTSKLPDNTFYHLYNTSKVPVDGQFHFLDVNGRLEYQLSYHDKKLVSRGVVTPLSENEYNSMKQNIGKVKTNGVFATTNSQNTTIQKKSNSCFIHGYLIVEMYDASTGQWVVVGMIFIYSGCPEEVQVPQSELHAGGAIKFSGPDGSQWNLGAQYEYAVNRELTWTAYSLPYGYISSTETVYGKKVNGIADGGYFTGATHGSSQSTDGTATWTETTWHHVPSYNILYLYLYGNISNSSGTTQIQEERSFSFSGLFP